jgi:hypothetical protein
VERTAVTVFIHGLQCKDEEEKMAFRLTRQSPQSSPNLGGGGGETFTPDVVG